MADVRDISGDCRNEAEEGRRWIIALVQMNCERRAARQLDKLNIRNFVAMQSERHIWSDRRKIVERIVLPMSVFLYVNETEERMVREYSFINRLMTYPGERKPAVIPDEQVERFMHMLRCSEAKVHMERAPLELGQSVIINRGSLRGLCGELTHIDNDKSHVVVRIDGLGCASIDITSSYVDVIE